jgi:hypothetical protein
MVENPEDKFSSNGLVTLCVGAILGGLSGVLIGWIIWG